MEELQKFDGQSEGADAATNAYCLKFDTDSNENKKFREIKSEKWIKVPNKKISSNFGYFIDKNSIHKESEFEIEVWIKYIDDINLKNSDYEKFNIKFYCDSASYTVYKNIIYKEGKFVSETEPYSSGTINPKPLELLNHFTLPFCILLYFLYVFIIQ